jgi:Tfp pilus assembly protein PilF
MRHASCVFVHFRLGAAVRGVVAAVVLAVSGPAFSALTSEEAWKALRTGDVATALQAAEAGLEDPDFFAGDWHLLKVECLLATGKYPEALSAAAAGIEHDSSSLRLHWAARAAALANGQVEDAAIVPETIEQLMASRSRAYRDAASIIVFGEAMLLRGTDPKVILDKVFSAAQKADPEAREPYLARGRLALEKNDPALAARAFQDGLKMLPDDADLHHGLAEAYASSDREAMGTAIGAALAINPNHLPSLLRSADHKIDAEDYAAANALLDRVLAVNPHHPDAWAYRAVLAHLRYDQPAEAEARGKALAFWKNNPRVDHLIGRKLSQKYRFAEGAASQRQALEFDPAYLPAKAQLASDLLRLGDEEEGWKLAGQVHAEDGYDVAAFNLMTLRDTMEARFATLKSENFTVRLAAAEAPIYGQRALDLLESARRTLGSKYGVDVTRPTIVEIFPEQKDFGVRTFGMPDNPGYLGVCFGRVVTANSPAATKGQAVNWEAVLWHEFCHTVTLQATRHRMPRWLSEGISVYEERQADPAWGEHMIPRYRDMITGGELTPVADLSGAFLAPPSPLHLQFAYFQSSLVVEFIIDRHGFDALKAVLADLRDGVAINDSLARRVAPLESLEKDFAEHARALADAMSPGLDWTKPEPELLLPGGEGKLDAWAAARPDNYYALQQRAARAVDAKDWAAAKEPLRRLITLFPRQTGAESAHAQLARVHRELNEKAEERAVLQTLANYDAAAPDVYQRLIDLATADGDWEEVARQARRYLAVNPLVPAPHRALAVAADKTGAAGIGVTAWRTLLALDPPNPAEAHYQLARWLHRTGDAEARRQVLLALEEAPRHRAALRLLLELGGTADAGTSSSPPAAAGEAAPRKSVP